MDIAALLIGFTVWAEATVGAYGYLGIFMVSLLGNLSVIFPVPSFALVFAMGAILNPWLVGLAGGLGGGIGEISGYIIGRGGRKAIKKKYEKQLKRVRKWAGGHRTFAVIVLFGATPLPSDIIGIFAGLIHYDIRKFLLASIIGKIIMSTYIAWAGYYSFDTIKIIFGV
ncbi:MAG: VTT domain-containing protein [Candidatus Aenigmarchaeota archaeon]|nr:VTT domain-containing protein [Candidatus Aenigmarchaeota archaeon]